jgi:hypothetical protein
MAIFFINQLFYYFCGDFGKTCFRGPLVPYFVTNNNDRQGKSNKTG